MCEWGDTSDLLGESPQKERTWAQLLKLMLLKSANTTGHDGLSLCSSWGSIFREHPYQWSWSKRSGLVLLIYDAFSHWFYSKTWLFATLWTIACQAPLSIGFSRQEYWSGLPYPPPGDLPDPGVEPTSLMSSALAGGFFTTSTNLGSPITIYRASLAHWLITRYGLNV